MAERLISRVPTDLAVISLLVLLVNAFVFLPFLRDTPVRAVLGFVFVLLVPGYVLTLALFPSRSPQQTGVESDLQNTDTNGLSAVERGALSVALSIALVLLVGLGLNYTPLEIRLIPVMLVVDAIIVLSLAVASYRGSGDPAGHGFIALVTVNSVDKAFVLVSLLVLIGVLGVVTAVPSPTSGFTEFYLVTDGEQGEDAAAGYPEELTTGDTETLVFGVQNNEHEDVTYSVVIRLQLVERTGDDVRVLVNRDVNQFENTLSHDETWRQPHEISPTLSGNEFRLQYLLYRGQPPGNPTAENAYRSIHLWVEINNPGDG